MIPKSILFTLLFTIPQLLWANEVKFDHLDVKEGLSQKNVFCMKFDSRGLLWVGTLNGLNRFDGEEFTNYKPDIQNPHSLSGNNCKALAPGPEGDMWAITATGGLNHFVAAHQKFDQVPDSLFSTKLAAGVKDMVMKGDWLWMLHYNRILAYHTKRHQYHEIRLKTSLLGILHNSDLGITLFGTSGIFRAKLEGDKIVLHKSYNQPIYGLCNGEDQIIGLGENSILIFNKSGNQVLFESSELSASAKRMEAIPMTFSKDDLWLGMNGFPLRIKNLKKKPEIQYLVNDPSSSNSFQGKSINVIRADKAGNIWMGTAKNGINFFGRRKNKFQHIDWNEGGKTNNHIVRAICRRSSGQLWLGFDNSGIGIIHEDGRQEKLNERINKKGEKVPLGGIRELFEDQNGRLWITGIFGLGYYNEHLKQVESIGLHHRWDWPGWSYAITPYDKDHLLISRKGEIAVISLEGDLVEVLEIKNQMAIRDMEVDNEGNIWIAFDNNGIGLIESETKKFTSLNSESIGLSNNKIYDLEIQGEFLWIGTNIGLNKFSLKNRQVIAQYFEKDGLSNDLIYGIVSDNKGHLWMSSNRGITKFNPGSNTFSSYLNYRYFMDDAYGSDAEGYLYFGGYEGVVKFRAEDITSSESLPKVHFQNFKIFNQEISPSPDGILQTDIDLLQEIQLKYNQNTFSLALYSSPFDYPIRKKFRVQLKNWEQDWTTFSGKNTVHYTQLHPGQYALQVEYLSPEGKWLLIKEININIQPPFWQMWWFQSGLVLSLILLILIFIQYRLRQVKYANEQLQDLVEQKTKHLKEKNNEIQQISKELHEADQEKLQLFTYISHEFRTPLTVILGYLEKYPKQNSRKVQQIIKNNTLRLLRLIDQLMDVRKQDLQLHELYIDEIDLQHFLEGLVDEFKVLASKKQIKVYLICPRKINLWTDIDKMDKIISNLLSNAIKYSPELHNIYLTVKEEQGFIHIDVEDQGVGIAPENRQQIFHPFFRSTVKEKLKKEGYGIGLALAKELSLLLQAELSLLKSGETGSTFRLSLKEGNGHFKPTDFKSKKQPFPHPKEIEKGNMLLQPSAKEFTLLILEDQEDLLEFLVEALSSKYHLLTAENGLQGLEIMQKEQPDLILTDLMMPRMDGLQFCQKIKEDPIYRHIPMIMLTAKNAKPSFLQAMELGIDDFITKPFDLDILSGKINQLLHRQQNLKQQVLTQSTHSNINFHHLSKKELEFWRKLNQIMETQLADPKLNMEAISEQLCMSRSTFYRKFKSITGENAAHYFRKMRLQRAAVLIGEGEHKINEISTMVGFESPEQFRIKFKEYFGVKPSEYH
ncbi:hybrid sensor histidine kinase/response regulator transcription factor [Persicobacter diffluens]|uniref:histidine kinase n=1 Tax=Persicobacter diffluens TaxID=981 RepID=A0AAN4W3J9_9BACT|nr:hybrid sensor histidine kinase/response regulator [Persicobacter diffluens]